MANGNRLMIVCMTVIVIACIVAVVILALHNCVAVIAAVTGLAAMALGVLSPSALHQAPPALPVSPAPAVAAENVEAVNVASAPEGS